MSALLRHQPGSPWPGGYASDWIREPWPQGEEREVEAHVALYLADTFPTAFEVLRAPEAHEELREPTLPGPFQPEDLAVALRQPVSDLVGPIRQGVYDEHLGPMWILERGGQARKTVIEALIARGNRLHLSLEDEDDRGEVDVSSGRPDASTPPGQGATAAPTVPQGEQSPPAPVDPSTPQQRDPSTPPPSEG